MCTEAAASQGITKEERIAALEAEITALNARKMTTTAQTYGIKRADPLEMFPSGVNHLTKNPDLMPCPRRPAAKK